MARVLVVDDDPDILGLVAMRLRKAGHDPRVHRSGPAAVAALEQDGAPDVAVLDVSMPGMSGFELLEALRRDADRPQLPAVFLSARVLPEDIAAGEALGARYLTKPFVAPVLLGAVEQALLGTGERTAHLSAVMGIEQTPRPLPAAPLVADRRHRSVPPPGP